MINDVSHMLMLMRCIVHVLMIYKHDVKRRYGDVEYVFNMLNFCHVFLIIPCVSLELLTMFEKLC